ncbi:MAG: hypothetical protein JST64_13505, partial [Actinobacteria bacterium]|nr:hypothetical protein [Actinomycetota bacterium]
MHRSPLPLASSDPAHARTDDGATPATCTVDHEHPGGVTGRRRSRVVALGVIALTLAILGVSCTKNAQAFQSVQLANTERASRGLRGLTIDDTLVEKAQAWAEHMAAAGGISHSVLTEGAGSNWRILG